MKSYDLQLLKEIYSHTKSGYFLDWFTLLTSLLGFILSNIFSKLPHLFSRYLFTCYLSKYNKSWVERFSKAKSIFKHVFYRMY